ncbi:hypothetical protein ACMD2_26531 [Ananas comosus]|uniref:Uncharacterized protein n=1 Tax=Ananas comosus TaxID=4615 RepID=A0A199UJF1_ANACO|nr:hypothetical protein ACMD2_26531 [Ananas comosus]
MGRTRLSMAPFLVLSGILLVGLFQSSAKAVACPQYCLDVSYVTCTSSGKERLPARCNCCLAGKGCTLHLSDGSQMTCS